MTEIQDYPSRLSDPGSRKFETFSYLQPMDDASIRRQVEYIVSQGWNPAIEHTEPENAFDHYWYMWKLLLFGETNIEVILSEVIACRQDNPGHHVRLVGYDNYTQSQGTAMVIHGGPILV